MSFINLLCTETRLGETSTTLRAVPDPDGLGREGFVPDEGCEIASGGEVLANQFGILLTQLWDELKTVLFAVISSLPAAAVYIGVIILLMIIYRLIRSRLTQRQDFTSLKTVTFGDESAVSSELAASILSIVLIFVIWGAFTGSVLLPRWMHLPGPFVGEASFTYTVEDEDGNRDDATVFVRVIDGDTEESEYEVEPGDGIALNDGVEIVEYRSSTVRWDRNDEVTRRDDGALIVAINGEAVEFDFRAEDENGDPLQEPPSFSLDFGEVSITPRGTLNVTPDRGWQMQPLYMPPPEGVWNRFIEIAKFGFQNVYLTVHLGFSLFRVILGLVLGAAIGIPLGYAMGLSGWFRGWFDPIVEFMRPVPPLALIPLVIIWFGIGEVGKIVLLFLAALWIMTIGARAGVSGVNITKIHAAYSLGASKWQIMRYVIIPNSLPEIFTAARVAMGVCWGTVVAAELVAANEGAGMMIMVASRFQMTEIVLMGIILIGLIGYGIDILMRKLETLLVPWKGRS